jgi:predicted PolB exonuclease-like 3'-5' exonuclease
VQGFFDPKNAYRKLKLTACEIKTVPEVGYFMKYCILEKSTNSRELKTDIYQWQRRKAGTEISDLQTIFRISKCF